ncbi:MULTISPECIES: TonB-dependent receptor [unclassified Microbulbifer]|uniref:TonB-dependent receptor n=1 Tax=unclassified Microbulbifer TaxID=2619833 RepID=UPI0027E552CC|nr:MULTISPECIES: TonB-dependent receptor [unclassified Microbulbifer]
MGYPRTLAIRIILCIFLQLPAAAGAEVSRYFSLPARPLAESLAEYSRIVAQAVVFDPRQVRGMRAPALDGEFTDGEALRLLLAGTPLAAEQLGQSWLVAPRVQPSASEPKVSFSDSIEEIQVTGNYRSALGVAAGRKRAANRRLDVVLAEDMGRFPALNVAEAINYSAGVSVVRDRGEALFVSLRGLPTQFNELTLNGRPLASNENVRTSEQYGRRFHYSILPSELVAGVEVRKSTTAADTAGAIGGSVNLNTFRPLDSSLDGGCTMLRGSAAASYSPLSAESDPRFSALGSWVNTDGSLGLLLGAAYTERSLRQDRALNFRWTELEGGAISPGGVRPTLELEESERLGLTAAVQWRSRGATQLDINLLDLRRDTAYREFSYSADYAPEFLEADSLRWRDGALIGGETERGSVQISRESAGLADRLQALDFNFEQDRNGWHYRAGGAFSRARSYNSDPIIRTRLRREEDVAFSFWYPRSVGSALPRIEYRNLSLTDPDAFPGRRLEWRRINAGDDSATVDLSAVRNFTGDFFESIEGGIQWRSRARDYRRRDAIVTGGIAGEFFSAAYYQPLPVGDFLESSNGGLPRQWLVPDEARFWRSVDTSALTAAGPTADDQLNSYEVAERSRAVYLQANFDTQPWRGNLGLRYVRSARRALGHWPGPGGDVDPVRFDRGSGILLPSVNLAFELDSARIWRLSAARVINRPDLQDLAPRLTLNSGDELTAVGGNPALRAVTGRQYDAAFEWYFTPHSLLSLGFFHTELEGFIHTDTSVVSIGGEDYELTTRSNGGSARVSGLELDYQQLFEQLPAPWDGLGIQANFALTDSRAEYREADDTVKDELADVAPRTLNLGVFYETPAFGVRLHYNWRDRVLKQVGSYNQASQNSEPYGTLDAQLSIGLGEKIRFFAEGINLTGAAERESVAGGEFAGYSYYGRTLIAGVKASF